MTSYRAESARKDVPVRVSEEEISKATTMNLAYKTCTRGAETCSTRHASHRKNTAEMVQVEVDGVVERKAGLLSLPGCIAVARVRRAACCEVR